MNKRRLAIKDALGIFIGIGSFQKSPYPTQREVLPPERRGKHLKNVLNLYSVWRSREGVIFHFLRGRGMDLFWNNPSETALKAKCLQHFPKKLSDCLKLTSNRPNLKYLFHTSVKQGLQCRSRNLNFLYCTGGIVDFEI